MTNDFLDKLQKIRAGFFGRMRFLFILDIISIFSIFYAIFIIFDVEYFLNKSSLYMPVPAWVMPPSFALIIAVVCAFLLHRKDSRSNVIMLIENKSPNLAEKLRTAYDNRDETNIIVESLKNFVSDELDKVSSSQLFTKSKIIAKILITVIFIAGATMVVLNPSTYSIPPATLTENFKNITGIGKETANGSYEVVGRPENLDKSGGKGSGDIFGKPTIASIQGKNVDVTIYAGAGTGFNVKDVSQTQNQFVRSGEFPVDVLGSNVSDGGYSVLMGRTETEKQLIDNYAVERSKI